MKKAAPKNTGASSDRLERYMAHAGLASRREAKDLISRGKVMVNGKIIREPGFAISVGKDVVTIPSMETSIKEYMLLYKPRGIETSKTTGSNKDIHTMFPKLKHLSPVGRLDKESEGLIILTNDGTLTAALTKENSHVGKTYVVTVRENVTDLALTRMATGIKLDKEFTKPAVTKRLARSKFSITLFEGRKHQIRRMCDACHLTIESLVRTQIAHLTASGMRSGALKKIAVADIEKLKSL